MGEELQRVLIELANQFGTTVPHLWDVILRQRLIFLLSYAFYVLSAIGMIVAAIKNDERLILWAEEEEHRGVILVVFVVLVATYAFVTFMYAIIAFESVVTAIFNPEYWVLDQIFDALRGQ